MKCIVITLCAAFCIIGNASAQTKQNKRFPAADTTAAKKSYTIKKAIIIEAERRVNTAPATRHAPTIEAALQSEPSVALIRRANFALEPTLRGMSGGQVAITIDGMKMHAACVDKMDPITAYVEPENLRQLEVSSGSSDLSTGQTQGGSLNLVTIKPSFYEGLTGNAELSASSNAPFGRVRGSVNYSLNNTAARGSFSVKRSGDYSAGGGKTIGNSGFEKENYKLDILQRLPAEQEISIGYIRDNARAIGYPALIMDATKTESNILSADYRMRSVTKLIPLVTAKIYWNSVDHLMDDYARSTQEIEQRVIMPGMYMPMDGATQTAGLLGQMIFASKEHILQMTVDIYHLSAFAAMRMIPITTGAPMKLINLAGVDNLTTALAAEWNYGSQDSDFRYRVAARVDYSRRSLTDTEGKNAFAAFWNSPDIARSPVAGSINASIEYIISNQTSLRLMAARASRLPTHFENYGFYLYNPLDNAIYMGNPDLAPERGWQGEVGIQHAEPGKLQMKAAAFVNVMENYIAGRTIIAPDTTNKQFPQAFRRYEHIGAATVAGIEADCWLAFDEEWSGRTTYRWQIGRAIDLKESLPWMPPMELSAKIRWEREQYWAELGSRLTARQTQYSRTISAEDETPGYVILDFHGGLPLGLGITLQAGVENILDKNYWEYSSVNNLPSVGRNVYVGAGVVF